MVDQSLTVGLIGVYTHTLYTQGNISACMCVQIVFEKDRVDNDSRCQQGQS